MKSLRVLWILLIAFSLFSCASGRNYIVYLKYQPHGDFPSLQRQIGSTVAIAPFKDVRRYTSYIGIHTPILGPSGFYKSNPFPLERAMQDSLSQALARYGVKAVPIAAWNDKPGSLKELTTDSILMIQIDKFWTESRATLLGTTIKTSIHLVIYLGVEKENKVFTRNVDFQKEVTMVRSTPQRVERIINGMLADIFDHYFSHPY